MEEYIMQEVYRLQSMNLTPSSILIDATIYEDIKAHYRSMVRVYGNTPVPSNTFMGLPVVPIVNLNGGFQVAVKNGVQSLGESYV